MADWLATHVGPWSMVEVSAYVQGISEAKAKQVALSTPEPGVICVDWPDGDWRAWRKNERGEWIEVAPEPEQAAPAEDPPPLPSLPSAGAALPQERAPGPTVAAAASGSTSGTGPSRSSAPAARVAVDDALVAALEAAPAVPAAGRMACALCPDPIPFEEMIRVANGQAAHWACARNAWNKLDARRAPPKETGERVKKARSRAGLTQKQVAEFLGVTQAQVSACELGKKWLEPAQLRQLATYLGVPTFDVDLEAARVEPREDGKLHPLGPAPDPQVPHPLAGKDVLGLEVAVGDPPPPAQHPLDPGREVGAGVPRLEQMFGDSTDWGDETPWDGGH